MDTLQLIDNEHIFVYTLKKGISDTVMYDEDKVKERYGFGPELLPDFKGLRGDPSDNIIGIKGIGEKTATTLITTFGSIEDIYKKLKKDSDSFKIAGLTPRIIKLLEDGEEEAWEDWHGSRSYHKATVVSVLKRRICRAVKRSLNLCAP